MLFYLIFECKQCFFNINGNLVVVYSSFMSWPLFRTKTNLKRNVLSFRRPVRHSYRKKEKSHQSVRIHLIDSKKQGSYHCLITVLFLIIILLSRYECHRTIQKIDFFCDVSNVPKLVA